MPIQIGDRIPAHNLKRIGDEGMEEIDIADYVAGRKVIIFGVPGAFTPSCSQKHLPGFVAKADQLREEGVDEIICIAVNDPFVMKCWGDVTNATGHVTMLSDWDAAFMDILDLTFDGSPSGLGKRARRFTMIVDDGAVRDLQVEDKGSEVTVTSAESCAIKLAN